MEILSCHAAPCYSPTNSRNSLPRKGVKLPRNLHRNHISQFQNSKFRVFSGDKSYVLEDEKDLTSTAGRDEPVTKVLIPSLPEGYSGAKIDSQLWEWKPNFNVYYEKSGSGNINSPPLLFLPGFGVGSFHYEKQLKDLGRDYRVWALDFLGQGKSLPYEDPTVSKKAGNSETGSSFWGFGNKAEPWSSGLVYSIDLWHEQVKYFVEEVIKEPVYIVGNSLGGYVALYFAACYPHLVKGVTLLNATPFWGFLPNPERSPRLAKAFPWSGTFPLPPRVQSLVELVWQKISDPKTIAEVLKQVYADHSTNVDDVFTRIVETTQHPAAAASFASIMFAPRGRLSFSETLSISKLNNIPICLIYGKEDPWVRPIWGLQVKRQVRDAPYFEISPAGHCPHDEVPEVVNYLLRGWIRNLEFQGSVPLPLLDNPGCAEYDIAKELEFVRGGSKRSATVKFIGSNSFLWTQISSFLRTRIEDVRMKFL